MGKALTKLMAERGVNLGGWLVLERWMTPSVFDGTTARNEYELAQTSDGRERIKKHHASFITKKDTEWLHRHNVTLLRVPVGHWIFGDVPHYEGALDRLDWLFEEAAKHNLQILLVLHGAPGAQNAKDHSGSGNWPGRTTTWLRDVKAQQQSISTLERLAKRYGNYAQLWGIELLNEPAVDTTGWRLIRFYRRAAKTIHPLLARHVRIVFSDGFRPLLLTGALWPLRWRRTVMMDVHLYYCFPRNGVKQTPTQAIRSARKSKWLLRTLRLFQPIIVGEWSAMLGQRVSQETSQQFIIAQHSAYRVARAHIYWSYKTEDGGRWSFRETAEKGMLQ